MRLIDPKERQHGPALVEPQYLLLPPQRPNVAPGVYCDLRCGRCYGASYTGEEGNLACVNCGRAVLVNAVTNRSEVMS